MWFVWEGNLNYPYHYEEHIQITFLESQRRLPVNFSYHKEDHIRYDSYRLVFVVWFVWEGNLSTFFWRRGVLQYGGDGGCDYSSRDGQSKSCFIKKSSLVVLWRLFVASLSIERTVRKIVGRIHSSHFHHFFIFSVYNTFSFKTSQHTSTMWIHVPGRLH